MATIPTDLHPETRLTITQVAAITGVSRSSFDKWRKQYKRGVGPGPRFESPPNTQIVRYRWADVQAWLSGQPASAA